jgi:hypothetical protein
VGLPGEGCEQDESSLSRFGRSGAEGAGAWLATVGAQSRPGRAGVPFHFSEADDVEAVDASLGSLTSAFVMHIIVPGVKTV